MSLHRKTGSRLRTYLAVGLASIIAASTVSSAASAATTPKTGGEATVAIPQKFAGFCFTTTTLAGPTLGAASSIIEPLFTKTPTGEAVGFLAPGATPREIVNRINAETAKGAQDPEMVKTHYPRWGIDPEVLSAEAFHARYLSEIESFKKVVRDAKIPLID